MSIPRRNIVSNAPGGKLTRDKHVLQHVFIASANHVTIVRHKRIIRGSYTIKCFAFRDTLMVLNVWRMRRNVNR